MALKAAPRPAGTLLQRMSPTRAALGVVASGALLAPAPAHALDWLWSFTAQPGSIPSQGVVSGTLLNLTPGTNVSGAVATPLVLSSPGGAADNQPFTFTFGTFSSSAAGVSFANARYDAVIGGVPFILFFGSDPAGATFFPQLFGGGAGVNLLNVTVPTAFAPRPAPPVPPAGIVPGGTFLISDPAVPTTFAGGTLTMDIPGTFTQNWTLGTQATNAIDLAGNTATLSGVFSGAGGTISFINSGSGGSLSLSGVSTYTGPTTVSGGTNLRVLGSIAASSGLTVQSGGMVGGTGFLPSTTILPGGIIAPGNSIGALSVANLALNGGTIQAELQGPQNDRINVAGNVSNFTGVADLSAFGGGGPWPGFSYVVVDAPNSTGFATPSSLSLNQTGISSALLRTGTVLIQEADGNPRTFDLQWRPTNGFGPTTSAMQFLGRGGVNQVATAGVFDRVFQSLAFAGANNANAVGFPIGFTGFTTGQALAAGISPDFLLATSQLLALPSAGQLTAAIDSLSPEPYAAFQSVGLETLKRQRELLLNQAGQCSSTGWVINPAKAEQRSKTHKPLCIFASAANASSSIRGSDGLSSYDSGNFSSFYGLEYQPSPKWTVGAAYGYGTASLNNLSLISASVTSKVNSASLYGVYKPSSQWSLRGLVGYSGFNSSGSRNVVFVGGGTPVQASPSGSGTTVALKADYLVHLSKPTASTQVFLKPFVGVAWGGYRQSGFSESGGGPLDLNVEAASADSLIGTLGFELASSSIPLNKANTVSITPRLAVAYQVDALANDSGVRSVTSSLNSAPVAGSFQTQGENRGVNTLAVEGGVDIQISSSTALYANLGYEAFSNGSQFTYGGGVKVRF
ncbi:autotransporter outer membrane beta-barrel domain-containing protein [Cyanobium sp. AMD-g]|uniref:autotransporter family protein n=1 Tax=Cyanobium sp. AMD-g TaxID=2823699 RepID=UPI0020CEFE2D|nr:autotransporter outer membrane beta-barrel domain-containing protein [Cyanobium sp. AMD-g]MCP9929726.1 autotransporter outer membrane beta-barrel domain-containing protein [Cyanobium sp. AMD-g]